jgi:four helix bundle protein
MELVWGVGAAFGRDDASERGAWSGERGNHQAGGVGVRTFGCSMLAFRLRIEGVVVRTRSYQDLIVWQRAMELVQAAYAVASELPPFERYGLSSQLRRSSASVTANIAEGHSRRYRTEFLQFLAIARASVRELENHLSVIERVGYADSKRVDQPLALCDEVNRMLRAMMTALEKRARAPRSPLHALQTIARKNSSASLTP